MGLHIITKQKIVRKPGVKRVYCLGVWDLFHYGHLKLIQRAAELGDLTVGVVCDYAVSEQKGKNRPIIDHVQRACIVSALRCVNLVQIEQGFYIPDDIIKNYDLVVIGADQKHIMNLKDIPKKKRFDLPRTKEVSTSDIVKKIQKEVKCT